MILVGTMLAAIGMTDLVRQFIAPRPRWIGYLAIGLLLVVIAILADAPFVVAAAAALTLGWHLASREPSGFPMPFLPAIVIAIAVVSFGVVAATPHQFGAGALAARWVIDTPAGPVGVDVALLALGVTLFLLESGNVVVRTAFRGGRTWMPRDSAPDDPRGASDEARGAVVHVFNGGRLIGPLERLIVMVLILMGAYTLLAAVLAAKGIVRFPEISKDGETGARAEYFLVGSLVSWLVALEAALVIWWGATAV